MGGGGRDRGVWISLFPLPSLVVHAWVLFVLQKIVQCCKFIFYLSQLPPRWMSCLPPFLLLLPVHFLSPLLPGSPPLSPSTIQVHLALHFTSRKVIQHHFEERICFYSMPTFGVLESAIQAFTACKAKKKWECQKREELLKHWISMFRWTCPFASVRTKTSLCMHANLVLFCSRFGCVAAPLKCYPVHVLGTCSDLVFHTHFLLVQAVTWMWWAAISWG